MSPQGHTPHSAGAQRIYYSAVPTTWRMMTRIEKVKKLDKMQRHAKERKRSMGGETTNDQTRDDMWKIALFTKTPTTTP